MLTHARVAKLANLLPDSENLANFQGVWLQISWFGDLANFRQFFESIWLHIFWFGEIYCSLTL